MNKKAVIYTRVSTDEQKLTGYSLNEQELSLRRFCEKNGWEVIAHYEEDKSAKDFEHRPAFNNFFKDFKRKQIKPDYFVLISHDRFSRDLFEGVQMERLLKKHGIDVRYLEGEFDLSVPENKIPHYLKYALAEVELDRIALRTKKGMRQAKREGRWVGTPPRGYKSVLGDNKKKILVANEDASLIIEAFTEFATGLYSTEQLRKIMWKKGLKVSENQFPNILKNPVYCAKIKLEPWRNEPEEIVPGLHEPLVSEILFDKVQSILNGTSKPNQPKKNLIPELPLRRFLVCECGRHLTGSKSKSRNGSYHYYYHCQSPCKARLQAKSANEHFIEFLKNFLFTEEAIELYKRILEDVIRKNVGKNKEKTQIEKEYAEVKLRLANAQDKFFSGEIEVEAFNQATRRYNSLISEMDLKKKELDISEAECRKFLKGVNILSDLPKRYAEGSLKFKIDLLGSIFPKPLQIFEKSYRTTQINEVVRQLLQNINKLEVMQNKKATKKGGFSQEAPPAGLEPATL